MNTQSFTARGSRRSVNLIQSELSKLSTVGTITVSPARVRMGSNIWEQGWRCCLARGCSKWYEWFHNWWRVDWCRVELWEQNRCYWWYGTAEPVVNFRLEYDGELTGYMPHDASAELVKSSLDALSNIGEVSIWTRIGPDVNSCHIWEVPIRSFRILVHSLFLWLMISTWLGQVSMSMTKSNCWHSTSIWWAWLWINCRSRHTRSIHLDTRIEAGHSILRTHLCFKCNGIQSIHHTLPAISNTVPTPTCTSIGSELLSI